MCEEEIWARGNPPLYEKNELQISNDDWLCLLSPCPFSTSCSCYGETLVFFFFIFSHRRPFVHSIYSVVDYPLTLIVSEFNRNLNLINLIALFWQQHRPLDQTRAELECVWFGPLENFLQHLLFKLVASVKTEWVQKMGMAFIAWAGRRYIRKLLIGRAMFECISPDVAMRSERTRKRNFASMWSCWCWWAGAEACNIFALLLFRLIIMLSKSRRIDSNGVQICTPLRTYTPYFNWSDCVSIRDNVTRIISNNV